MEKLIIFGVEHPIDKELELDDNSEFGMDITIEYVDGFHQRDDNVDVRQNCTEFHHLYNKKSCDEFKDEFHLMMGYRSAFESDIHGTGGTRDVFNIKTITVRLSTELHETHFKS